MGATYFAPDFSIGRIFFAVKAHVGLFLTRSA